VGCVMQRRGFLKVLAGVATLPVAGLTAIKREHTGPIKEDLLSCICFRKAASRNAGAVIEAIQRREAAAWQDVRNRVYDCMNTSPQPRGIKYWLT